jgi:hypothetical protein
LIQAFQASCNASSAKPGSSAQRTGIQRLLGCDIGGGSGPVSPGSTTVLGGGGAGMAPGREGLGAGGVEQAASVPTISAVKATRRSVNFMGLILLEALLALVLLVAIVWWTMFSGRKGGELQPPPQEPLPPPPAASPQAAPPPPPAQ